MWTKSAFNTINEICIFSIEFVKECVLFKKRQSVFRC